MSPPPAFSQALGERPPPAVRASLAAGAARHVSREARAARGATGEARGQAVPAQRHPPSRHAARPPARASPPPDRPRRPRRPRRRGGPPGPPGPPRPRLPGDAGPAVGGLTPAPWRHCAAPGRGAAPTPWRPQGIARPPSPPVGTASPWPPLGGTAGGEVPRAPWPAGGPRGTDGPGLQATGAGWTGAERCSQRTPPPALAEVGGGPRRGGRSARGRRPPGPPARPPARPPGRPCPRQRWPPSTSPGGAQGASGPGAGAQGRGGGAWGGRRWRAAWGRTAPGPPPGRRGGGVSGAGRRCAGRATRGAPVAAAQRPGGRPCWGRPTRGVPGGSGGARVRASARPVARIGAHGAAPGHGSGRRGGAAAGSSLPGRVGTSSSAARPWGRVGRALVSRRPSRRLRGRAVPGGGGAPGA